MTPLPEACDLLVAGSGAGALVGALSAARRGLDVLVVEKQPHFGGTTAYSGAGMWLPGNSVARAAGAESDLAEIDAYLDQVVRGTGCPALRQAFLETAAPLVDELLELRSMELEWKPFPDYFPEIPGASERGRAIFPLPIKRSRLGAIADQVIPPLPTARGGHDTGDIMIGGQALIGRLLLALAATSACCVTETELVELEVVEGSVTGAVLLRGGRMHRVVARRGVLLAAGGFEQAHDIRTRHHHPVQRGWTMGAPGATGSAHTAAIAIGAATALLQECWWTPAFDTPDGPAFRVRDRGHPGSIMVDQRGQRFVNESLPYDRVGHEMASRSRSGALRLPAWFIIDHAFLDRYGINGVPAGHPLPEAWYKGGYVRRADTLEVLAAGLGLPVDALGETVRRYNEGARLGRDELQRGESPYDRFFGDPEVGPNPCLAPIEQGPFYALPVVLSDLGTKGGLVCDARARVLDERGVAIPGLYAAGNTMAAWSGDRYPAPGVPIASSMVFGHLAAVDAASS